MRHLNRREGKIRKYLEPEGFILVRSHIPASDKETMAEECLDDIPAVACYHQILCYPEAARLMVEKAEQAARLNGRIADLNNGQA